ncbi:hypothetical protein HK102_000696, partial [Quaeritorhiza haematococci]
MAPQPPRTAADWLRSVHLTSLIPALGTVPVEQFVRLTDRDLQAKYGVRELGVRMRFFAERRKMLRGEVDDSGPASGPQRARGGQVRMLTAKGVGGVGVGVGSHHGLSSVDVVEDDVQVVSNRRDLPATGFQAPIPTPRLAIQYTPPSTQLYPSSRTTTNPLQQTRPNLTNTVTSLIPIVQLQSRPLPMASASDDWLDVYLNPSGAPPPVSLDPDINSRVELGIGVNQFGQVQGKGVEQPSQELQADSDSLELVDGGVRSEGQWSSSWSGNEDGGNQNFDGNGGNYPATSSSPYIPSTSLTFPTPPTTASVSPARTTPITDHQQADGHPTTASAHTQAPTRRSNSSPLPLP